jgi:hypothetical protein
MNAPLDMGTPNGAVVAHATHRTESDVTTGEALSSPRTIHLGKDAPPRIGAFPKNLGPLIRHGHAEPLPHTRRKWNPMGAGRASALSGDCCGSAGVTDWSFRQTLPTRL